MFSTNKSNSNKKPTSFPPPSLKNKVDYAIISAMKEETDFFSTYFENCPTTQIKIEDFTFTIFHYKNNKILVLNSGIGTAYAAMAFTLVHLVFQPEYFFIIGTAGGINSSIQKNDVVVVQYAFEAELQTIFEALKNTPFASCLQHPLNNQPIPNILSANEELLSIVDSLQFPNIKLHKGCLVTSNAFPAPKELFEKIKALNPLAIDMETSSFYQNAWLLKAKTLAFRGISNLLNSEGEDEHIDQADIKESCIAAARVLTATLEKSIELNKKNIVSISHEANYLIKEFGLQPHPEGGFFKSTFKSSDKIKSCDPNRYEGEERSAGTSIYYLLDKHDFSAWHILKSDEIWHFHKGSALNIYTIDANGNLSTQVLGDPFVTKDANFQAIIKAGTYFAAENIDKEMFSFVGCTVSPGFEYTDFKLADQTLSSQFPQHKNIIERLSRTVDEKLNIEYSKNRRNF